MHWSDCTESGSEVQASRRNCCHRYSRHPSRGSRRWLDALDHSARGQPIRYWKGHRRPHLAGPNLKPWMIDTFKVSNGPRFEEKLVDVVGLYLNPAERAIVFSFDEKT